MRLAPAAEATLVAHAQHACLFWERRSQKEIISDHHHKAIKNLEFAVRGVARECTLAAAQA